MKQKIMLSADSTSDLGNDLQQKYDVQYFHYHIQIAEKSYIDMVEITPGEIYAIWRKDRILPQTAAITPNEYYTFFKKWVDDGFEIIHVNLGSALSSAHQNCVAASQELGHVYPINSANLSSGTGLLVIKAAEMIRAGLSAREIQDKIIAMRARAHASFVLDTLEFLKAGGRCSALAAFGANLLGIKPCIEVDNQNGGQMTVGKKYRGTREKILAQYVCDKLADRDDLDLDRIFITHSSCPDSEIELESIR